MESYVNNFHFGVDNLGQAEVIGQINDFIYFRIDDGFIIANQRKTNFGSLVYVVRSDFRYRCIKVVAQPADNRFDNFTLPFQRAAFMQSKSDDSDSNDHRRFAMQKERSASRVFHSKSASLKERLT
jgi:hypothetical protein